MGGGLVRYFVVVAVGCSADAGEPESTTPPQDEAGPGSSAGTLVTGSLGNSAFTLRHAALKRATATDPRTWVCVTDVAVSFAQCEAAGGPDRTMFLGPFHYQQGTPRWGIVQVGLYRVGAAPLSALAKGGTIEILDDDPSGSLELRLTVDFGEVPQTTGMVSIQ